jgi:hypothetical protein
VHVVKDGELVERERLPEHPVLTGFDAPRQLIESSRSRTPPGDRVRASH